MADAAAYSMSVGITGQQSSLACKPNSAYVSLANFEVDTMHHANHHQPYCVDHVRRAPRAQPEMDRHTLDQRHQHRELVSFLFLNVPSEFEASVGIESRPKLCESATP